MEPGTKSQRGGEGRREWNRGGGAGTLSSRGGGGCVVQFLVTPLMMGPVCLFSQDRVEEPVRPCLWVYCLT